MTTEFISVARVESCPEILTGDILPSTYTQYLEQARTLAKNKAESIVELSALLNDAERRLRSAEFTQLCCELGIDKGGSSHKKYRSIGNAATRFRPFMDYLPHGWTTLYKLSCLSHHEFYRLVNNGSLSPKMTAEDIDRSFGKSKTHVFREVADVKIYFGSLTNKQKAEAYKGLIELAKTFNFEVGPIRKVPDEINEIDVPEMAQAA